MKKLLLVSHKMNLGGTEKALLSLLYALEGKNVQIDLLLLEHGGELLADIPQYVNVSFFPGFDKVKDIIEEPPLQTLKQLVKTGHISGAISHAVTYAKIKTTGEWYHNYIRVLGHYTNPSEYDIAVAFAGPSDFISYLIAEKINASTKVQWIHFDIEKVIHDYGFGKKFYPKFQKFFCVSDNAKKIFLKHFPELSERTETFHNIVSEREIKKLADEGETFSDNYDGVRILTVGRLSKEKGQDMIPEAADIIRNNFPEFKWYLVGDGKEKNTIEEEVKKRGLDQHVVLTGSKSNPYGLMRDCDIYVQTSLHEGYGLTVHEAKIFDKPIVVTAFASASNLISDGNTGLICEINPASIAELILKLLKEQSLRTQFSRNIREEVKDTTSEIDKLLNL